MRKAAKILFIIGLVIGLIWATVGFFGTWFGGAVVSAAEEMSQDIVSAEATAQTSVNIMLRLLGSFVVVIIGGVLGIVGAGKGSQKLKLIVIGFLTIVSGFILFPLSNYITAVIYIVAGLLLFLAGLTMKQQVERKKLMIALISMGLVLIATVGIYYIIEGNSEKQEEVVTDNIVNEQNEQNEINEQNEQSATNETETITNQTTLPADFITFIDKFTESRENQISYIKVPLKYIYEGYENYEEDWDNTRLNEEWTFLEKSRFVFGKSKVIDPEYPDDERYDTNVSWSIENNNTITYKESGYEWSKTMTFKKNNNNWNLIKIYSYSS